MDTNQLLINLGIKLTEIVASSTVSIISDKISKAKTLSDKDRTIQELESIIDGLISDKRQLIEIGQKYEEVTSFQKLTDEDVLYVTKSILPVLEELLSKASGLSTDPDAPAQLQQIIDVIKPIISVETFNVLQMLGFNFRDAIGAPLTELIKSFILSKSKNDNKDNLSISINNANTEYYRFLQNEEAVNRFKELTGK